MKLGDHVTHPAGWAGIVSRIVVAPGVMVEEADWPDSVVLDLGAHPDGRWLSLAGAECDGLVTVRLN